MSHTEFVRLVYELRLAQRRPGTSPECQRDLELQPRFQLLVNGHKVGTYVGDFAFVDCGSGQRVVQDVKGVRTPIYRLKKKLLLAIYGVQIEEV